jgi:hypothetical protein
MVGSFESTSLCTSTASTAGNRLKMSIPSSALYAVNTLCFAVSTTSFRADSPSGCSVSIINITSFLKISPIYFQNMGTRLEFASNNWMRKGLALLGARVF